MACSVIPKPGSKLGPCKGGCHHVDCRQTIRDAQTVCWFCLKPIGYERAYFRSQALWSAERVSGYLAHADCMEIAVDNHDPRAERF
jgi:hypothetical protein